MFPTKLAGRDSRQLSLVIEVTGAGCLALMINGSIMILHSVRVASEWPPELHEVLNVLKAEVRSGRKIGLDPGIGLECARHIC